MKTLEILVMEYEVKVEEGQKAERIRKRNAYLFAGVLHFDAVSIGKTMIDLIEDIEKDTEDVSPLDLGSVIYGTFTGVHFGKGYNCWGTFTARDGSQWVIQQGEETGRYAE